MVSGCEECVFGEGDVFFLEEKKLHGAYNDFNQDRIHIIFDIVPQKGEHKGIPFNTYQDWNMWQAEREKIS